MTQGERTAKSHAWVELYFDLVFVFAIGQLAHLIVVHPQWGEVVLAFVLFLMLWSTWIGFVFLYNRYAKDRPSDRLLLLVGSIPCAVAAVEAHNATSEHLTGFSLALAGTRLVLATAYLMSSDQGGRIARRAGLGYVVSAVLLVVSAIISGPVGFALWAIVLVRETGFLLLARRRRFTQSGETPAAAAQKQPPDVLEQKDLEQELKGLKRELEQDLEPGLGLRPGHLAERFDLFMIIMLGEVVISVGSAAADVPNRGPGYWLGLTAGLILAGALWWIYFDSASRINRYVLRTTGGHPGMAYRVYAGGYILPTFALLIIAAGCGLALHEDPPPAAVWMVTVGLAGYLIGIRAFVRGQRGRHLYLLRVFVIATTVSIALLERVLYGPLVVATAAIWAVIVAAAMSRHTAQARLTDL